MVSDLTPKRVLVITQILRYPEQHFLSGLLDYVRTQTNWNMRLLQQPDELCAQSLDRICAKGIDGIITTETGDENTRAYLEQSAVPLVVVGSRKPVLSRRKKSLAFVTVDDRRIGKLAARHFVENGKFRTYLFIDNLHDGDSTYVKLRKAGFLAEIRSIGGHCITLEATAPFEDVVDNVPKPLAAMTLGDKAREIINHCHDRGFKIPEQVSLLAFGNSTVNATCSLPTLSCIDLGSYDEGYEAGRQMARLLGRTTSVPLHVIAKSEYKIYGRETTSPLKPVSHLMAKAHDFIRRNAVRGINVSDVARNLGISRRLLDLRFCEYNGRTVAAEIRNAKLDRVKKLLSTTSLPAGKIAAQCGFASETNMMALFKRTFNVTMKQFRST